MYETELEIAILAASEACILAREVQGEIVAAQSELTKEDRSPVTIADLAAQILVSQRLSVAFPDDPLLAEEDSSPLDDSPEIANQVYALVHSRRPNLSEAEMRTALDRGDYHGGRGGRFWILDPVDGTKGFLRQDQFAVALALVDQGEVVAGVLGCPNLPLPGGDPSFSPGCMFAANRGGGTLQLEVDGTGAAPVRVIPVTDPAYAVLCESVESGHSSHDHTQRIAASLGITNQPYRLDSQCKYGVVARGEASIYLRLPRSAGYREKTWDHAAGALVIEEAGGRVTDLHGTSLDFSGGKYLNARDGILASNGALHDVVLAAARAELGLG